MVDIGIEYTANRLLCKPKCASGMAVREHDPGHCAIGHVVVFYSREHPDSDVKKFSSQS